MKVYISGKMAGMNEKQSRAMFKECELALKAKGCKVVNPWDTQDEKKKSCKKWGDFIRYDLELLDACDVICLLPSWLNSKGAMVEYHYAKGAGMKIWRYFYGEIVL